MEISAYKSPEAELLSTDASTSNEFYVVSVTKFTALFFATLGVYSIYWFYKNWVNYKIQNNLNIWPVPRSIFNIFFVNSLFTKVQDTIAKQSKEYQWSPGTLAVGYIVLTIISNGLDRMAYKEVGSPISDILSFLTVPIIYLLLVKAQKAINFSQNDPAGESNCHFSTANIIWIVIGIALWGFTILGYAAMYTGALANY